MVRAVKGSGTQIIVIIVVVTNYSRYNKHDYLIESSICGSYECLYLQSGEGGEA